MQVSHGCCSVEGTQNAYCNSDQDFTTLLLSFLGDEKIERWNTSQHPWSEHHQHNFNTLQDGSTKLRLIAAESAGNCEQTAP